MKEKATCDMKNNQCCKDLVFIVQLEKFINDNYEGLGSAAEDGKNEVEAARADLEWTKNHKDEILAWLQNQQDGSGNIATNTILITVAFIITLLHNTQIFNYIM